MSLTLTRSDDQIRLLFKNLQTRADVAALLEITEKQLIHHLYITKPSKNYKYFSIRKRSGGSRIIMAPRTSLKIIQQKLNYVLSLIYKVKPSVHGFAKGKSIRTNAKIHVGSKIILNVDLQNFFPSINFGRVRGMFLGKPYLLPPEVATCLAQICCNSDQLPQGAPTSPIISNMLCAQMDSKLQKLARKYGCRYTRYADDITISTITSHLPKNIAHFEYKTQTVELGADLMKIIKDEGFKINDKKIRLMRCKCANGRRNTCAGLPLA